MSIVRVGATKQYSDNWESVFSKGRKKVTKPAKATAKKVSPKKKPAKKK